MRKRTKTSLTKSLDTLCSKIIRSLGRCEKCGRGEPYVLHTHHVYGRANRRLRWDLRNLVCLCFRCHGWSETNPLDFTDWFDAYRVTDAKYLREENAKGILRWELYEMEELETQLKEELNANR